MKHFSETVKIKQKPFDIKLVIKVRIFWHRIRMPLSKGQNIRLNKTYEKKTIQKKRKRNSHLKKTQNGKAAKNKQ